MFLACNRFGTKTECKTTLYGALSIEKASPFPQYYQPFLPRFLLDGLSSG